VDELLRRGRVRVTEQHALAHAAGHAAEANADLIGDEFADGADTAVAEVVDVVFRVTLDTSLQAHEVLERRYEAVIDEAPVLEPEEGVRGEIEAELAVHLEAPGVTEVVAARVGEEPEEVLRCLVDLRRVARAQDREQPQERFVRRDAW